MPLADLQRGVRAFVVDGEGGEALRAQFQGGADPLKRLSIHRRHYHASLVEAMRQKFPATAWLVGDQTLIDAASVFVVQSPPSAPCIAEYGQEFPRFLAETAGDRVPYVRDFATLEWQVGSVSIAVDATPLARASVLLSSNALFARRVMLQPGVRYARADWPVDTLMDFFLNDSAPESFAIAPKRIALEIRGARGKFTIRRVSSARLGFREALVGGATLADAWSAACSLDGASESSSEIDALFGEGMVVGVTAGVTACVR